MHVGVFVCQGCILMMYGVAVCTDFVETHRCLAMGKLLASL